MVEKRRNEEQEHSSEGCVQASEHKKQALRKLSAWFSGNYVV